VLVWHQHGYGSGSGGGGSSGAEGGRQVLAVIIVVDLFYAFQHQSPYPHAQVGGHDVHQPEARQHFEAMDVQLQHTHPLPALLTGIVKFMHVKLVYGYWPNQTSCYEGDSLN